MPIRIEYVDEEDKKKKLQELYDKQYKQYFGESDSTSKSSSNYNNNTSENSNNLWEQIKTTAGNMFGNVGYGLGNGLIGFAQNERRNKTASKSLDMLNKMNVSNPTSALSIALGNLGKSLKSTLDFTLKDNNTYNSLKKANEDNKNTILNFIDEKLQNQEDINNENIQKNIQETTNPVGQKLVEIAPSIGQMIPSAIPGVGTLYSVGSATDSYYDEAKSRGMNEEQASNYSQLMGMAEGLTEMIGVGKLVKGGKGIAKGTIKEGFKDLGISIADNFMQEAVTEPISELVTKGTAGDEYLKNDYRTSEGWKNLGKDMLQSGFDGAITAGIMGGVSAGLGKSINIYNKLRNGQQPTANEYKSAFDEQRANGIDVDGNIQNEFKNRINQSANQNTNQLADTQQDIASKLNEIVQNDKYLSQEDKQAMIYATNDLASKNQLDSNNTLEAINQIKQMSQLSQEQNEQLDIGKKYLSGRKEIYNKYRSVTDYDNSIVQQAKDVVPSNKQGKRTKEQWLDVAKYIGTNIADKSNSEIQEIAYKSWQEENPNNSATLNKQGQKYVKFMSDEWIDTIYDAVEKQRQKSGYVANNDTVNALDNFYKEYTNNQTVQNNNIQNNIDTSSMNLVDSAKAYNLNGNDETIQSINQKLNDRGIASRFDGKLFTNADGTPNKNINALWTTTTDENGNTNREIVFNPYIDGDINEQKTMQQVTIHEMLHDMAGDKQVKEDLFNIVLDKNKTREGYSDARSGLEEVYSQVYDKNSEEFKSLVDEEEVADTLAQKLGDQDFINSLNKEKPNVFKRIYNWVVDKLNKFTGSKSEKIYWEDVKNKFESAYRQDYQGRGNIQRYHVSSNLSAEIDQVLNGKYDSNNDVRLRDYTPKVLTELGIKDYPMLMNQDHLKENILSASKARKLGIYNKDGNYHNLGKDIFIKAIDNLDNPLMVMKSISQNKKNTFVIVTDVQNKIGEQIIVPIYLEGKGNYNNIRIDTNKVKTVYGKKDIKQLVDNTIKGDINNILYMTEDKNKRQILTSTGLQLSNSRKISISTNSITTSNNNVNTTNNNSMQKNANNTKNEIKPSIKQSGAWQSFLENQIGSSGKGKTIQELRLPTKENWDIVKNNNKNSKDLPDTKQFIVEKRTKKKLPIKEIKDELAQKIINKGHYIDKLAKKTGDKNLTYLYDRTLNSFNEAQISIGDNQVNSKGEVVGKSLNDIFKQAEEMELNVDFEDYLLNKHNIARTAFGKSIYGDTVSAPQSKRITENYEKQHPEFKEWAKEVNKYNDNNLKDLVDNGLVSKETYDKLKEMYGDYVPTYRDITETMQEFEDNRVGNNTLKSATKSNKNILSVKESMAEQTLAIKKAIRINNIGKELYKILGKDSKIMDGIEVDPTLMYTLDGEVVEKAKDGQNTFAIFDDGEITYFKISDDIYSAFSKDTLQNKINNSEVAKALLTPVEKLSQAQRNLLTTYSIGFAFNNPIKDFQDAVFNSKYSTGQFLKNYSKALYNIAKNGDWYKSYKNNGGTANTYFDYNKGLLPTKTKNPIKKFVNKIKDVNEILEQAPRLSEYISTIENNGSIDEALYNAAEITTNFKRGGDIAKVANKYGANFLNASIQGLDKFYRNLSGQNGWKGYARLITKATLFQVVPSIVNGLLLKDDDDYSDLPEYTKDNYFLFKIGDGKFFRIPKGRVSSLIGGLSRRVLETAEGKEVDWKSLVDTTVNQMAPNNPFSDNVLAPIKQAIDNKAWYGGEIVSSRLQKLPTAEQYDEKTDNLSKIIGKYTGVSPKKINYVLDQYSGGIGDVLLPMMTPQAENNILEDKFTTDAVLKNKNVSKYYEEIDNLEKNKNSENATDNDILKYKYMSEVSKDLSDLYSEKRNIENSNLSDKEKKVKVRKVQKEINNIVEERLDNVETINSNSKVAKIGDSQYYKYHGEWTKLSDDEKEKNKKISLKSYADFKNKVYNETEKQRKSGNLKENQQLKNTSKSEILLKSNYSDKEKLALYKNYVSSTDKKVEVAVEKLNMPIDVYLNYKTNQFENDKDKDGETISGTKKQKVYNYVNSLNNVDLIYKYLIVKMEGINDSDGDKAIINYVNKSQKFNFEERKEALKTLGFKVDKYGNVENMIFIPIKSKIK